MAGRDEIQETVRTMIERVRRGLHSKSVLMVGLRGVGKTVLLDRMRDDAERAGIHTMRVEAPEERSLPALLAPEIRQALLEAAGLRPKSPIRHWSCSSTNCSTCRKQSLPP